MTKKIFLTALCALALCPAFAQTSGTEEKVEYSTDKYKVETNSFWDNTFVSFGVGGNIYFGDHDKQVDFGKRLAPAFDIAVGKWFTPGIGVRVMYNYLKSKGATQDVISTPAHSTGEPVPGKDGWGQYLRYSKFNMGNLHADVMFNVLHLFGDNNLNCKWDLSPYVGIGWAHVYDSPKKSSVSGNFGLLGSYNINETWAVNADLRGVLLSDGLDGEKGARAEGDLSFTLGVSYKF